MSVLTLATARATPLPIQSPSPSRSSAASNCPVDAPDGTIARPDAPEDSHASTSTVGLPRESRTCRPTRCSMVLMWEVLLLLSVLRRYMTGQGALGRGLA